MPIEKEHHDVLRMKVREFAEREVAPLAAELDEKEINNRLAVLPAFEPRIRTGYLARYSEKVTSASTGAVFSR